MLEIEVPASELFDEEAQTFIAVPSAVLRLEHSLVSIPKWESKWKKPFLTHKDKTREETLDYIKCMSLNQNLNDNVYLALGPKEFKKINDYIDEQRTATTFSNMPKTGKTNRVITSEQIYYWMAANNIPFECQKWHLSRLLTLLQIAGLENSPKKKMPRSEVLSRNRALNQARRKARGSKG